MTHLVEKGILDFKKNLEYFFSMAKMNQILMVRTS